MIEARGLVGFSPMNILTVNLLFSTLVFGIAARIYVLPRLRDWGHERVLTAILVLHSFRHLGLMFLAPGAVYVGLPPAFARPAALGDLIAALLALVALAAVRRRPKASPLLLWSFHLEGALDPPLAILLAARKRAAP